MHRRSVALLASGAAVAAPAVAATLPAAAAARTKVVYAGGPTGWATKLKRTLGASIDNFLVNRVTIAAGDTVRWDGASLSAGFHTVDIPAAGGSALATLTPTGSTVTGVNDAGGHPYWFNGRVPQLGFNPLVAIPSGGHTSDGSRRVESGLPTSTRDFRVTFTKAGVYRYFCDIHPGMVGYVVVKAHGTKVPSAQADAAQLKKEQLHFAGEARSAARTRIRGNNVSLGVARPGGVEVFAMFPRKLKVKKGTVVRFSMSRDTREAHTATFGPDSFLARLAKSFQDPIPNAAALYPSDPAFPITLAPSSHGNGFANTGVLDRDPATPLPASGTIRFTRAGTYRYICLIHPFMVGKVVVK